MENVILRAQNERKIKNKKLKMSQKMSGIMNFETLN